MAGPWPERIGCRGYVVRDPGDGVYPFDKPLRGEVVIKLDADPAYPNWSGDRWWTCVIGVKDVRVITEEAERG
jgi:hypothetical protein